MIRSLEDAWRWYEAVSSLVGMMDRVARRYFHPKLGKQTLEDTLHRDDKLLDSATIRDLAKRVTEDLDDLAVLLLFSVFEATVRVRTLEEMDRELEKPPRHLVLKKAVDDAKVYYRTWEFRSPYRMPTRLSILISKPWLTR